MLERMPEREFRSSETVTGVLQDFTKRQDNAEFIS